MKFIHKVKYFENMEKGTKLAVIGIIITLIFGITGWIFVYQGSHQIFDLQNTVDNLTNQLEEKDLKIDNLELGLNETRKELESAKDEIITSSIKHKDEILLALYEVEIFGFDNKTREEYFQTKFSLSYEQALNLLNYTSKTDDFDIAIRSLLYNDYETSLYHFDMALIKDPGNIEAKMGKSIALNELGRTNESRNILFEIESIYANKKFLYKLIGDSYCIDKDYQRCTEYYFLALGNYFMESGKKDIEGLKLLVETCELKATGKYNSTWISIEYLDDNWKICEVKLKDFEIAIATKYKTENPSICIDYIFVRKYHYPEPTCTTGTEESV